jgi:hypothetical protein
MLWGFAAGLLLLGALVLTNLRRAHHTPHFDLKPNVLLTRYPLVFVSGHRSLFYFLGYWDQIPPLLAAHGFEVFNLTLPWQGRTRRIERLRNFLEKKSNDGLSMHLFIDSSTKEELEYLLKEKDRPCLVSVTLLQNGHEVAKSSLNALHRPIEDLALPSASQRSWVWTFHRWLHPQLWKLSSKNSGFLRSEALEKMLLERSQFLAERDLLRGQSSPRL